MRSRKRARNSFRHVLFKLRTTLLSAAMTLNLAPFSVRALVGECGVFKEIVAHQIL